MLFYLVIFNGYLDVLLKYIDIHLNVFPTFFLLYAIKMCGVNNYISFTLLFHRTMEAVVALFLSTVFQQYLLFIAGRNLKLHSFYLLFSLQWFYVILNLYSSI
ncbi:hypothetical protein KFK09_004105 [Dendrobium nobile]|uniref:Uncharacterized protein n=1 Tax=Dendrobium nobile TaxID=94219 RepID=A0A8T3BH16_DENNO|nr:hypothetical protein KFK09_012316 [Dendrobium nobile]KAI0524722.1 hypothetical protein KFK09_004105 [Dendrobium nobile]